MRPQLMNPTLKTATMMRREWSLPSRRTSLDQGNNRSPPMTEERSGSRVWVESHPPLITVAINYNGINLARTAMTVTISLSLGAQEI